MTKKVEKTPSEVFDSLIEIIDSSVDYFDKNDKCHVLKSELINFKATIETCHEKIVEIEKFLKDYDINENTPGNGYRSFVDIFVSAATKASNICGKVNKDSGKLFFRADHYAKEIGEWNVIVQNLSKICSALIATHQNRNLTGCLFSDNDSYDNILTQTLKSIDQKPFYGKNIGFQFCTSMELVVKFVVVSMACYFSFYFKKKPKVFKVLRFPVSFVKNFAMPKKRAVKATKSYDASTTEFCRSFWFLFEGIFIHPLSSLIAPKVEVNKVFKIHPEALEVYSNKLYKMVEVPVPKSHIGFGPIQCRLLSAKKRKGMLGLKQSSKTPRLSKNLIFHVHGGGFASQTSKSHETYMRKWAVDLDVPIISIDYSLVPQASFPRALEEVFYAYCWTLKNSELLGSTGENIVFVGDSAGGNLVSACTIKCIEMGIQKPKGVLNIYAAVSLNFKVAPSRFLSLVDPILPFGFISRLMKDYASIKENVEENDKKPKSGKPRNQFNSPEEEFNVKFIDSYLVSPYNAPDEILVEFPPTKFVTTNLDPCLDDSVEFAKKLKRVKVETSFDLVKDLPHGFLYFHQVSNECHNAVMLCADKIQSLL